ncbi:hypothetical protein [Burkholderia phage BCSR5]|nr:hypothetical protein [Burkholderia phage BCSR5]
MTILAAYGLPFCSPITVSNILRTLRVSHSIVGCAHPALKPTKIHLDGLSEQQPAWPIIVDKLSALKMAYSTKSSHRRILLVCDSYAALGDTNVKMILESRDIRKFLEETDLSPEKEWELRTIKMSMHDYVNIATKPSFLNHVQTAVYKISNYSARKQIRSDIVKALYGVVPLKSVVRSLDHNLKYETLRDLMASADAVKLRDACLSYRSALKLDSRAAPDEVAKEYGFEPFELLYVVKSYEKELKDLDLAKKGLLKKRGRPKKKI